VQNNFNFVGSNSERGFGWVNSREERAGSEIVRAVRSKNRKSNFKL
jgi:hypothetical protein